MTPLPLSAPAADTVTDASFCQADEPPEAVTVGAMWSSFTVAPAVGVDQSEVLLSASTARNSTSVVPSADTVTVGPDTAADQVAPPSVELRWS